MLCIVSDLEEFLQIDIPVAKTNSAEAAIRDATAAIVNYCRQEIELVEDDEITLDCSGGTKLFLPSMPVVSVAEVIEDGETLIVSDDYQLGQHGVLHRVNGHWPIGIQIITVTYTHGYAVVPDDVMAVCIRAAARAYQSGLRSEEMEGMPGVASKSLGDFSVTYGSEQSVGAGEAMLGVSAAPFLLKSEKAVLDRYRFRPV